jgi:opioid growth factor receptor-like protein
MFPQATTALDAVRFYRGEQKDHHGRSLREILSRDHDWLEHTHDYIQWLFPLTEASAFNPYAPILSSADILEFNADKGLRSRLTEALNVMLHFYGLNLVEHANGGVQVVRDSFFETRRQNWLKLRNHNFLRITRILKSLCLLGLHGHAQAFYECLSLIYRENETIIGEDTFEYWRNAVR